MNPFRFYSLLVVALACSTILVLPHLMRNNDTFFTVEQSGKWGDGNLRCSFILLKTEEASPSSGKDPHILVRLRASLKAASTVNLRVKKLSCYVRCQGVTLFEIPVYGNAESALTLSANREVVFEVSHSIPKGMLESPKMVSELVPSGVFNIAATHFKDDMFMTNLNPVDLTLP